MQTQEPAGTAPGAPASDDEADRPGDGIQSSTEAPADAPLSGSGPLLWGGFAAFIALFALGLFGISRLRSGQIGRRPGGKKAAATDYFQPAGEDVEIVFEEEPAAPPPDVEPPAPKPRRSFFGRRKKDEAVAAIDAESEMRPLSMDGDGDAEVVIERPETVAETQPFPDQRPGHPRKASPFSGLFSKRKRPEEPVESPFSPGMSAANDEMEATVRFSTEEDAADESDFEAEERRRQDEAFERRLEHEREEARRAEEEHRRDFARRTAERETEFERRKIEAAAEQRQQALETWERALTERESRAAQEAQAFRDDLAREFEARVAALDSRPAAPAHDERGAGSEAHFRDLEAKIARLGDRFESKLAAFAGEARTASASAGVEDRIGALGDLITRRFGEHRDSINAALQSMSLRIDAVAGAPAELRALREEFGSLKRSLGDRATSVSAPTVQLTDIVRNALAPNAFEMRATLPNNRKADCLIKLPHPPGPIAIDARFPAEAFARLPQPESDGAEPAENEFRRLALRHIVDIAERLIVPNVTAESALMFVPSETMHSELHARFPDVVQDSYRARVWIVSPTTLMATLHTIRGVFRDAPPRAETVPAEPGRVLAEVEALRRRVASLEEGFGRAGAEPRIAPSPAERRVEPAVARRTVAESFDRLAKKTAPQDGRSPERPEGAGKKDAGETDAGDLWEDRGGDEQKTPFPLR